MNRPISRLVNPINILHSLTMLVAYKVRLLLHQAGAGLMPQ